MRLTAAGHGSRARARARRNSRLTGKFRSTGKFRTCEVVGIYLMNKVYLFLAAGPGAADAGVAAVLAGRNAQVSQIRAERKRSCRAPAAAHSADLSRRDRPLCLGLVLPATEFT